MVCRVKREGGCPVTTVSNYDPNRPGEFTPDQPRPSSAAERVVCTQIDSIKV
jgi:hypothetical protein